MITTIPRQARARSRRTQSLYSILQRNVNSLSPIFPDLRILLQSHPRDVLALRETYVRQGQCQISGYVGFNRTPPRSNKKECASIYIKRNLKQNVVHLSAFSSTVADYTAATIRLHNRDVSVVPVHVCPGSQQV